MTVKIITVTHKEYRMPQDSMYLPIGVGKAVLPFIKDDTGENISDKNSTFCELTALYWAWKNLDYDYIGLAHYRRHFKGRKSGDKWESILTEKQLDGLLKKTNVILPQKRNYYIETNYSQYIHAHHKEDLDETEKIIREFYPEYIDSYNKVMESTKGHRFNMFIMRKDILDSYCTWVFDILFRLEQKLDTENYSEYDSRVFGFVGERLLDVWIDTNDIKYKEIPVMYMENQNWFKKGYNFLKRKFVGKGEA